MRSRLVLLLTSALLAACSGEEEEEGYPYTAQDLEITDIQLLDTGTEETGALVQVTIANHTAHDFTEAEYRLTCEFWGTAPKTQQDGSTVISCVDPTQSVSVEPVDGDPLIPASSVRDFSLTSESGAQTGKIHCTLYWDVTQRGYGYYISANYPTPPPC